MSRNTEVVTVEVHWPDGKPPSELPNHLRKSTFGLPEEFIGRGVGEALDYVNSQLSPHGYYLAGPFELNGETVAYDDRDKILQGGDVIRELPRKRSV